MTDDLWGRKRETDCHSQFANWLRNDGEICNTAGNKCTVHALAVGPSRQKIPDIVECHDTELYPGGRSITDQLCTKCQRPQAVK